MRKIDVHEVIDNARFNRFHWMVLFWCALIIIFDGYDLVIYGVVLPMLMKEWGLSPLQAGALGSYALFGMMFGALFFFGPLSDKIGRKKAITICVVLFSGFTVLNGFARNPTEFGLCRFIAGLGIGGVMPNVVALMNEYAPKKNSQHAGGDHVQRLLGGRHALGGARHRADPEFRLAVSVLRGGAAVAVIAADHVLPARIGGFHAASGAQ